MSDPRLKPGSRICLCRGCNSYFASVSTFDAHRYGDGRDRRCYTEFEMRERGFGRNAKGVWLRPETQNPPGMAGSADDETILRRAEAHDQHDTAPAQTAPHH